VFLSDFYQILKLPLVLVVAGVLVFGFFCPDMVSHASMHGDMNSIAVTQISNQQTCCNTSISKNIEAWKSTFLVIPREMRDGLLLLILGLAAAFAMGRFKFSLDFTEHHLLSYKLYARANPDLALFNHLKLALARGILNPKVF